jgi:hypothetical protein
VTSTLEQHPELQRLLEFGVAAEQMERFAVLCLPENLPAAGRREDLLDSQDAVDLAKRIRAAGISCANSFDLTPEAATVHRRGADLWLGVVWVLDGKAAGTVAAVIIRKLKGWTERTISRKGKVHLSLRVRNGREVSEIEYRGSAGTLVRILEGLRGSGEKEREPTQLRRSESSGE